MENHHATPVEGQPSRARRTSKVSRPAPAWLGPVVFGPATLLLLSWLSPEAGDFDTWWHLKTGQLILTQHRLPVPDPFAWTTCLGKPLYPGEEYRDAHDLIYMRRPPPDVQPLDSLEGWQAWRNSFLMDDGAPSCARGMIDVFTRIGDEERARKWAEMRQAATSGPPGNRRSK